ncbi:MAG: MATE family efflux transporter, partial [Ekhidna sp.]
INIIILGAMSDELQVGYFSVIQRISMVMTLPLFAINAVITPLISRHFKNGEFNKLKRSVKRMSLFALVSTLPFFLLVFTFPKIPLTFFGQEYSELGLALIVISIGQLINVSAGSVGYVLQLCDKHILYRNIILATVIIIIMSSIILIPIYNVMGACISNAIGMIFLNVTSSFYVKKEFNFYPTFLIPR